LPLEITSPFRPHDQAAHFHPALLFVLCELAEPSSLQGISHAERPKDTAPLQARSATYFRPKAVDVECGPRQTDRLRERATKLRAISRASPRRSPDWQHCRGGKLLSTRRTLLQIDVRGPRRDIVGAVTNFQSCQPSSSAEHEFGVGCWHACYHDGADISLCGGTYRPASDQFTFRCRPVLHGVSDQRRACNAFPVDKN
jgi:hypothetical protein